MVSLSTLAHIKDWLKLFRFEHQLMLSFAVFIGMVQVRVPSIEILFFSLITPIFIGAASFALNDYFDLEVDRINRPSRPLVRGLINPKSALISSIILYFLGILSSILVSLPCMLIALIYAILSAAYDAKLKEKGLIGNIIVAAGMAIPFIYGGFAVTENPPFLIYIFALIVFLVGLGREILKGIVDVEGDKLRGVKSIPLIYGEKIAAKIAANLILSSIILSLTPILLKGWIPLYIVFLSPTVAVLLYCAVFLLLFPSHSNVEMVRKMTLIAFIPGLISFFALSIY